MEALSEAQAERFLGASHRIAACGLVRFSSGNLSWRFTDESVAVTCMGAWLGELTRDQIALCRLSDGTPLTDVTASVEAACHVGIYRARPDVNVVLHCQSPYATAVACSAREDIRFDCIPEVPFYIGDVAVVPYRAPGSPELAAAVVAAMKDHDLVCLRNHGQVVAGSDFTEVIQKAGFFELACEVLVHAGEVRPLAP